MANTKKRAVGVATIDVEMVVVRTKAKSGDTTEIAVDTANKEEVEPQTEDTDAVKLVKKNKVIAQKLGTSIVTGNQITLTDNVFIPELVKIFQGGTITPNGSDNKYPTYTPPVAGSTDKGEVFEMDIYSAVYDAAGLIDKYEKITYPNCQGLPISMSTEDGTFRVPEYTINSAPKTGEAPYTITYVDALPDFTSAEA